MPDFHLFAKGPRPVAPFSHAVEADGWVILTGQMPTDPAAPDAPLPDGVIAQTERVMKNLELILQELDLDLSHIVQCRANLTEFERDYAAFNETYQTFFPQDRRPARTTVGVTALAVGALVEIDCVARRPDVQTKDISAQQPVDISRLDLSMLSHADLTNIVLQRSEVVIEKKLHSDVIRKWTLGDQTRMDEEVKSNGVALAQRAARVIQKEFDELIPILDQLQPKKIADIGCGYGFFDLFAQARYDCDLLLIDIESNDQRHFGFREEAAAYTSLETAQTFLTKNGVSEHKIKTWNPEKGDLDEDVKLDLAVSFLSCGYHFPVDMYMPFFRYGIAPGGAVILDLRAHAFKQNKSILAKLGKVEVIAESKGRKRVLVRKGKK